jgi:hypothetical protein
MIGRLVSVTPGNAEDEYLRKAAHRARLEMLESSPPALPAPDPVDEALKVSTELREVGRLN